MAKMIDAALAYAGFGWHIFPCDERKAPLTKHGFKDASNDAQQICKWWGNWPDANVGLATGSTCRLFVIDIDNKEAHDFDGYAAWNELTTRFDWHADASGVLGCKTPSWGSHLYFNWRPSITNGRGTLPPGIDVRGDGGYVLIPPSRTLAGEYKWWYLNTGGRAMDPPQWLLDILAPRKTEHKQTDTLPSTHTHAYTGTSIIDEYNAATNITDLLAHYGYTVNENRFTRPGKNPIDGISGTIKGNRAYTFSANDPAFRPDDLSPSGAGCTLTPFSVLVKLSFGGDVKAAVKYLVHGN